MNSKKKTTSVDTLVVGAGFAGSTISQCLAKDGKSVLLVDKREHIAGNAYDYIDENGILIHKYGPHIFHTNSDRVFEYLSQFTNWRFYEHRVKAKVGERFYPIPINRTTINQLYGKNFTEEEAEQYLESVRVDVGTVKTSQDAVLKSVGHDLCEKFFRNYTKKQWGLDLSELSAGVAARIPTRTNDDDRYFTDKYQFMPSDGYTEMFEKMLSSPLITTKLNSDYQEIKDTIEYKNLIFTGPIDAYYDYCFGKLPYRSLDFKKTHTPKNNVQECGTLNFPNDHEYTRTTEFKHLTGQDAPGSTLMSEYPQAEGDPYYPIPKPENNELFRKYKEKADAEKNVFFIGRLAQYKYYNMDQVVAAALHFYDKFKESNA